MVSLVFAVVLQRNGVAITEMTETSRSNSGYSKLVTSAQRPQVPTRSPKTADFEILEHPRCPYAVGLQELNHIERKHPHQLEPKDGTNSLRVSKQSFCK